MTAGRNPATLRPGRPADDAAPRPIAVVITKRFVHGTDGNTRKGTRGESVQPVRGGHGAGRQETGRRFTTETREFTEKNRVCSKDAGRSRSHAPAWERLCGRSCGPCAAATRSVAGDAPTRERGSEAFTLAGLRLPASPVRSHPAQARAECVRLLLWINPCLNRTRLGYDSRPRFGRWSRLLHRRIIQSPVRLSGTRPIQKAFPRRA